ncbi:TraR/DksA C4-type zinc finger protein [Metabacillus litoralis]|uniref:TraR/DksA C4-type zinc finger protein n=1 Tax=Metabacillus litoralis TaxID=152268 RepID=UPI001CFD8A4C|nr:TraR/DksA C4-type zinc finger protein [Metabacillus litoralis]
MISSEQKNLLKNTLKEEKQKLKSSFHHTNETQSSGELSNYDNHPADTASELYEKEADMAISDHVKEEINKIENALQAMSEGTYGYCKECGKSITFERLEAVPTSLYCINHTNQNNTQPFRPVEEEVIDPSFNNNRRSTEINDYEDSFAEVAKYGTSETPSDYAGDEEDYQDKLDKEGFTEDFERYIGNDMKGKKTKVFHNKK